jgi:hypothetical protein
MSLRERLDLTNLTPRFLTCFKKIRDCKLEDEMFQSYVKDLVKRYKKVENIRKQIIKRYDFNLIDAFFICKGRKEFLNQEDFKLAINLFDVFPTEQELYLLFIRYSNKNKIK